MHNKIYTCFPNGKSKAFTCSYDDGKTMDRKLVSLMNMYGIKSSFHLNSDYFGVHEGHRFPYISSEEVLDLYEGHEVACHTCSHITMTHANDIQNIDEVIANRKALEMLCQYPVTGFSYPNGCYNEHVIQLLKDCGISYARTTKSTGRFDLPNNFLEWHPTCHHKEEIFDLLDNFLFQDSCDRLSLFSLWGHSYEFSTEDDWQRIELFFKKAHGKSDIWYASSHTIQKYIVSSKQLQFFADQTQVYNPCAIDVWINLNGEVLKLDAGHLTLLNK